MSTSPRQFRTYIDTKAGQVHCRVARPDAAHNSRPSLLCMHMSQKSGWAFESLLSILGHDRLIVAPDTPGFGMSDRPDSPPELADYTDALAEVAAALMPGTAWDLLGYHTGSVIAADMALRYPARVRRIVMISAPLLTEAEIAEFSGLGLGRPRDWDEDGAALVALWRLVLRWRMAGTPLSVCARSLADTLLAGDTGWWGHRAAFTFDVAAAFRQLQHPVAIINPGDDLAEATRRARALLPGAVFVDKPAWSHGFIQVCPDEAADLVRSLLAGSD